MGYSYNTHGTNICTHTEAGRQVNTSVQCMKHDCKIHTIKKKNKKNILFLTITKKNKFSFCYLRLKLYLHADGKDLIDEEETFRKRLAIYCILVYIVY